MEDAKSRKSKRRSCRCLLTRIICLGEYNFLGSVLLLSVYPPPTNMLIVADTPIIIFVSCCCCCVSALTLSIYHCDALRHFSYSPSCPCTRWAYPRIRRWFSSPPAEGLARSSVVVVVVVVEGEEDKRFFLVSRNMQFKSRQTFLFQHSSLKRKTEDQTAVKLNNRPTSRQIRFEFHSSLSQKLILCGRIWIFWTQRWVSSPSCCVILTS